jgi:iron complex outermembrane recepter protein
MNTYGRSRVWLASTGLTLVLAAIGGAAYAQEAGNEVSEVVVTGSRLPRINVEAPTPTQVVSQERLEAQGFENITDILTTLPQFAPSYGSSRTQSTFSGACRRA